MLGNVFIADSGNERIREVIVTTGIIYTVAGTGIMGYSGDGSAATNAKLNLPAGVTVDSLGDMYIADANNECIRKVSAATENIYTFAGIKTNIAPL